MKTVCCVIGLSLLFANRVVATEWLPRHEPKPLTEKEIASRKEDFKNPEKVKAFLMGEFPKNDWSGTMTNPHLIRAFAKEYEITVEVLRSVLADIYRDSARKTGWEFADDWDSEARLHSSILWMSVFADESAKKLLLDIAMDAKKDIFYRYPAVLGYFRCANAQEVRDLFVWLLSDDKRFPIDLKASLLEHIRELWREVEADRQKREAILASLCVAVAQEKDMRTFGQLDGFLAQNSAEYATSNQRVALLQKKGNTSRANGISESQKTANKPLTNVSTSLTELKKRDFRKPVEEGGQ